DASLDRFTEMGARLYLATGLTCAGSSMKPRCGSAMLLPRRHLGNQTLDVCHDALSRGRVAVADRRHVPLIDALSSGRVDVAAYADTAGRALEVVDRRGTRSARRCREPIRRQSLDGARRQLRVRFGPGRNGVDPEATLCGHPPKVRRPDDALRSAVEA